MSLPDFIIAGAPKCGTSALWKNLNDHPELYLSDLKEPTFFTQYENKINNDIVRPGPTRIPTYRRGSSWYDSIFKSQPGALVGEASTVYMSMPDSPSLIYNHLPKVKLIFVLRDPVKRMYSHYWQDRKVGIRLRDFEVMVKEKDPGFNYYKYVSQYRIHLERYLRLFPNGQIKVVIFEDLKKSTNATYKAIFDFLGVNSGFVPPGNKSRVNLHTQPKIKLLSNLIWDLRGLRLVQRLPDGIRTRLGRAASNISKINSAPSEYPELSKGLYSELSHEFRDDIEYLEKLLKRRLECWKEY